MTGKDIQRETSQIVKDVLEKANLKQGAIFVFGLSLLNVRLQSSLVWKSSVSFLLFMQEVLVSWQPSSL